MKKTEKVKRLIDKIPEKKLFFASDLYKKNYNLNQDISEPNFYKILERLVENKSLSRVSKGIYTRPKETKYGLLLPTSSDIVEQFIEKENGMLVGYHLYNQLKLTTQISKKYHIFTKNAYQKTTIQEIFLKEYKLKYTKPIKEMISMLEVLSNIDGIQDLNETQFIHYCRDFSINLYDDDILKEVLKEIKYKKKTLYFLKVILDYYHIENTIYNYLSKLSKYKIPEVKYYEVP